MFVIKNYVTTGGTVACALAIGYLMQNGTPAQPQGTQVAANSASYQSVGITWLEHIVLTSSAPSGNDASEPHSQRHVVTTAQSIADNSDCAISARAVAVPGAAAHLSVIAPCHSNSRIDIHHRGLTVTQKTDKNGKTDLTVPALSEYAIFLISTEDQQGTVATTHIPEIAHYNRVALQWTGQTDLQIHALEFGASYGGKGHVSADPETQGIGKVVHLGHTGIGDAKNIQVYSYPAGQSAQSGSIALSVEAEVTAENCGQELALQSLELRGNRRLQSRDLSLTLPDCGQSGEFLVLNNLLEDLTIAAK
ncbi:hypothetical protein [Ruegeria lacuscaerulensis]|uniref:hypothetical protein n=1 Tax=Ruegeria lacuscaerulensis TaxID=55218 RepID=UPI001581266C|nr:hypothetical protein [Ruegeria lacuscaerulensis]